MPTADDALDALRALATPARAEASLRYFQAFPGGYAEGDAFLGVTVPDTRRVARTFRDAPLDEVRALLDAPWHEARVLALHLLVDAHARAARRGPAGLAHRAALVALYLDARSRIDNWDLVDTSAWQLLGTELRVGGAPVVPVDLAALLGERGGVEAGDTSLPPLLAALAEAPRSWDRRIAMVATFAWTRAGEAGPALAVAERLHADLDALVLKSVGWQLREVGQRCGRAHLDGFLERFAPSMGRVALRAALEHHAEDERAAWRARR